MIDVEDLRKRFVVRRGRVRRERHVVDAVNGISFRVDRGELLGYLGPNGAGKSTTIKMLTGILVPSGGRVSVAGLDPSRKRIELARRIGAMLGQRIQLWWDLPLRDSFELLRHIYRVPADRYEASLARFREVLELDPFLETPVRQLSLGQRIRGELTAAMLHGPELLFLDEPTIGLDIVAKANVREFLQEINRQEGTTVLLTTHDLADIETLCRRVIVIDHGRLLFDGALNELRDRILPVTAIVFDVKRAPDASELSFDGWQIREVGLHRYRLDVDRRKTAPATAVKEIVNRFDVSDLQIEEPEIEEVVKRIYQKGVA